VAGACAVLALASAALVGACYSATLWVQEILGLDPVRAGLALLPVSLGIVAGAAAAPALTRLRGERGVAVLGLAVATLGMLLLLPTPVRVPMAVLVPALAVLAVGFGVQSVPVSALATVVPRHHGLASAAYQTAGQIGGGVGLVVLAAVAAARTAGSAGAGDQALVAGYHASFAAGAGALLLATLVAARLRRDEDVPPAVGDRHAVDADRPRRPGGHLGE
jgi:Na+/melibiose symporter-like transporter